MNTAAKAKLIIPAVVCLATVFSACSGPAPAPVVPLTDECPVISFSTFPVTEYPGRESAVMPPETAETGFTDGSDTSGALIDYITDDFTEPSPVTEPEKERPEAQPLCTALYSLTSGSFVSGDDVFRKVYPASITKLATCLYASKLAKADEIFTVGYEIYLIHPTSSAAGLAVGEKYRFRDLLYAMMLPSGNDAAYTVAAVCGRKIAATPEMGAKEAVGVFMDGLNKYLKKLGAKNTFYTSPDGIAGEEHFTCVHDTVIIAKEVLKNRLLSRAAVTRSYKFTNLSGRECKYKNSNALLKDARVKGLKNGFIYLSGYCIVAVAEVGGERSMALVFGAETLKDMYRQARGLLGLDGEETETTLDDGITEPDETTWETETEPVTETDDITETVPDTESIPETETVAETESISETEDIPVTESALQSDIASEPESVTEMPEDPDVTALP